MSGLFAAIDNYCERTDPQLWSEPLNAITNASFLIAAYFLFRLIRSSHTPHYSTYILIFLVTITGIGSALFHTFANLLTMLMDVIPIMLFVLFYLWFMLRYLLKFSPALSYLLCIGFFGGVMLLTQLPAEWRFNGSILYFPCFIMLLLIAGIIRKQQPEAASGLTHGAWAFAVALFFRTIDQPICNYFPTGTHMFWHIINGYVLYVLVRTMAHYGATKRN